MHWVGPEKNQAEFENIWGSTWKEKQARTKQGRIININWIRDNRIDHTNERGLEESLWTAETLIPYCDHLAIR